LREPVVGNHKGSFLRVAQTRNGDRGDGLEPDQFGGFKRPVPLKHDLLLINQDRHDVPESGDALRDFLNLAFGMNARVPFIDLQ